jgi:predicted DCC family thiol-disulfide oxidoreductase YuxK
LTSTVPDTAPETLRIVYDGECPFCSRFVALYRIRQNVGRVELIDARTHPELVAEVRARGYEINDGMIAIWRGRYYYGADGATLMALLSAESGFFARLNRLMFRNPRVAGIVYPILVRGRKLALRLMGRKLI